MKKTNSELNDKIDKLLRIERFLSFKEQDSSIIRNRYSSETGKRKISESGEIDLGNQDFLEQEQSLDCSKRARSAAEVLLNSQASSFIPNVVNTPAGKSNSLLRKNMSQPTPLQTNHNKDIVNNRKSEISFGNKQRSNQYLKNALNNSNNNKVKISDPIASSQYKPKSYYKKNIVIGKNGNIGSVAAPRPRFFYTGRWSISTKAEEVKQIMDKFLVVDELIELKTVHSKFKSFKFKCDVKFIKDIFNSENWPTGIVVKRFFEAKDKDAISNKDSSNVKPAHGLPKVSNNQSVNNSGDDNME